MEPDKKIEEIVKEKLRKEYQEFNPIEKYTKDELEYYYGIREAWVKQNYKILSGDYNEEKSQ